MLNEKLEYKQYLLKNKDEKCRLYGGNIYNNLVGVPRALEIIARYELFKPKPAKYDTIKKNLVKWIEKLNDEDTLDYIFSDSREETKENIKDATREAINTLLEHYVLSSIAIKHKNCRDKRISNNLNAITWDRTIASALERGPLKEYILVEKEDFYDNYYKFDRKTERAISHSRASKHKDFLLKFTAYYLLENKLNQKSVVLNESLIYNWALNAHNVFYYSKSSDGSKVSIFQKQEAANGRNKFTPDEKWISNFEIVDISEDGSLDKWLSDSENNEKTYYIDRGAFELLEKHVCKIDKKDL